MQKQPCRQRHSKGQGILSLRRRFRHGENQLPCHTELPRMNVVERFVYGAPVGRVVVAHPERKSPLLTGQANRCSKVSA